jgi:hypothetical protein
VLRSARHPGLFESSTDSDFYEWAPVGGLSIAGGYTLARNGVEATDGDT